MCVCVYICRTNIHCTSVCICDVHIIYDFCNFLIAISVQKHHIGTSDIQLDGQVT